MDRKEFDLELSAIIKDFSPIDFRFSWSSEHKFLRSYRAGVPIKEQVLESLNILSKRKNLPFYWYFGGCSLEDSVLFSKTYKTHKISLCKHCSVAYRASSGFRNCCSEEHYIARRKIGNKRLSESRLKYNNRDPIQYADRHGISIEEAITVVDDFVKSGSNMCIEYWIKRGYSEEESIKQIAKLQRRNSQRCIEHWLKRGYSEEESLLKLQEYQSLEAKKRFSKYTKEEISSQSSFSNIFWENKGYSPEEAVNKVKSIAKSGTDVYLAKYTREERKEFNVMSLEYWQKKYPETWETEYISFRNNIYSSSFRSLIADNFCKELSNHFINDKIYYGETEFGIMDNGTYIKIDFVNSTRNFCVEFLGDYWHANPIKYSENESISYPNGIKKIAKDVWENDNIRFESIRKRGFKLFLVWESDYKSDQKMCIEKLLKEIRNES